MLKIPNCHNRSRSWYVPIVRLLPGRALRFSVVTADNDGLTRLIESECRRRDDMWALDEQPSGEELAQFWKTIDFHE